eukprot:TRINITY_DN13557_c0_g1_i5.p1 TRINITY_DN13557_c0_g1~~TRINITY_DN13557_c0_g1_i5.p1  ORF type:complete len:452 (-),score=76.57 TRINITY_DN13557_c0_g1_i5:107-1462(-)
MTLYDFPRASYVSYRLENPVTGELANLTIPWQVYFLKPISFSTCHFTIKQMNPQLEASLNDVLPRPGTQLSRFLESPKYPTGMFLNNQVYVLKVTTFDLPVDTFSSIIYRHLSDALSGGASHLIIDLLGNQGTNRCNILTFVDIFSNFPDPVAADILCTPLVYQIVNTSNQSEKMRDEFIYDDQFWRDHNGKPFTTSVWYLQSEQHTRGGIISNYSSQNAWTKNCNDLELPEQNFHKILIFTDGLCLGTCALGISILRSYTNHVRVVGLGTNNESFSFTSMVGGLSANLTRLTKLLEDLGLNDSIYAPKPFITSAFLSLTVAEVYFQGGPSASQDPLEFEFRPTDYYLFEKFNVSQNDLYQDVAGCFTYFNDEAPFPWTIMIVSALILVVLISFGYWFYHFKRHVISNRHVDVNSEYGDESEDHITLHEEVWKPLDLSFPSFEDFNDSSSL